MKFTPNSNTGAVIGGVLAIAMGLVGISPSPVRSSVDPSQASLDQRAPEGWGVGRVQVTPAVDWRPARAARTAQEYYRPVSSWYKSKRWWKKNAPIIGGAAGGAVVGGLIGGGHGALIGGAIGAGGGYAYKRLKHHHSDHAYRHSTRGGYQEHHPHHRYHHAQ
jgi:hypothetical protein